MLPPFKPPHLLVSFVILAVSLWAVGSAAGAGPGRGTGASSAVSQYVEMVPTASGDEAVGVGAPTTTRLPPPVSRRIDTDAGEEAAGLRKVVTSSSYGAPRIASTPQSPPAIPTKKPELGARREYEPPLPSPSLSNAFASVLPSGGGDQLLPALVGLLVATAAVATLAWQQRQPA